jgi:hypothetical protein
MPDICHLFVSELRATFSFRPSLLGVDPNRTESTAMLFVLFVGPDVFIASV